ncbi:hypothetical protein CQW23_20423 [Capsicum baccatum]|uniref:Disease resistance protein winged helix domain-containing protein n=1 Tax=Capsicum baccatum TaxID=33114 RepID=A0A2G2W8P8_CAPBA|nr:hypothetical protein CQW23_20423 [Capsicum baccatum]
MVKLQRRSAVFVLVLNIYFQNILESISHQKHESIMVKDLEGEMRVAVQQSEDLLESNIAEIMRKRYTAQKGKIYRHEWTKQTHSITCYGLPLLAYSPKTLLPPYWNNEIDAWTLIRLWVAEGCLKNAKLRSPEEVGEECLGDLVTRNLLTVQRKKVDGRIKSIGMHDLLRDLSVSEAEKEKLLNMITNTGVQQRMIRVRRILVCIPPFPWKNLSSPHKLCVPCTFSRIQ